MTEKSTVGFSDYDKSGYANSLSEFISITDPNGDETIIEVEFDNDTDTLVDRDHFIISQIKGPWISLGFHIDFQARYIDLHFVWWIITVGRPYHKRK